MATSFLEGGGFDYMILGGYALPFYGAIRTTLDIDLAVMVMSDGEFSSLSSAAERAGLVRSVGSYEDGLAVFQAGRGGLEVELWLRPDGVVWDTETLSRRRRQELGGVSVWIISPEDFVVNKLARRDRGVQDEKDVAGVLERMASSLGREYLLRRAKAAGVEALLEALEEHQGAP